MAKEKVLIQIADPGPDSNGKPFDKKTTFFLNQQSDQRKILQVFRKKVFYQQLEVDGGISFLKR